MNYSTCDSLLERLSHRVRDISKVFIVNVNAGESYSKIYNHFPETQKIHLSQYTKDDEYPDLQRCYAEITNRVSEHNLLVVGFSQHFSVLSEGDRSYIFSKILNLKLNSKPVHAVIFLFYGYDSFLRKKITEDPRLNESIFLLDDSGELPYPEMVFISPDVLINIEGDVGVLPDYAHYLSRFEEDPEKSLFVRTQFGRSSCPKLPYPITSISSAYDLLVKMKDLHSDIPRDSLSEKEWAELFSVSGRASVYRYLSTDISSKDLQTVFLGLPQDTNKKRRWLYLKYLAKSPQNTSYLRHVLLRSTSLDDFERRFFEEILEIPRSAKNFTKWYRERKEGIKQVFSDSAGSLISYIQNLEKLGDEMIYYLTDISNEEKQCILRWISQHPDSSLEFLDEIYPDLWSYLHPYSFSEYEQFTEYFQEYKIQKIQNILRPEFLKIVNDLSDVKKKNHPYLTLNSRPAILEKIGYDPENRYWFIDCLGSEYLGFITKYFTDQKVSVQVHIVSANLPTETIYNTEFREEYSGSLVEWGKLDTIKHEGDNTPSSLEDVSAPNYVIKELESLKECLQKIAVDLQKYKKVIIISDHGSSRLCVLNYKEGKESSIKVNAQKVKTRYCESPTEDLSSITGLIHERNFFILADYKRFSIQGGPRWEVHGGATLEEVVIPIIELTKSDHTYQIVCPTKILKVKPMKKIYLEFSVSPICDREITIFIRDINEEFLCSKKDKEMWMCELPDTIKSGSHTATVRYRSQDIGEFMFSIEKGMKKIDLLGGKK